MNKNNVARWFIALVFILVAALAAGVATGIVSVKPENMLAPWNMGILKIIGIYLAVINVITFALFAVDKAISASESDHRSRVPEARLLGLSLIGGSIGGLVGMHLLRHKTKKWYFTWGLPVFLILDAAIVMLLHGIGLL